MRALVDPSVLDTSMTDFMLQTRNESWGFYGTSAGFSDPEQAWALCFAAIYKVANAAPVGIRDFLDSRHGRHFADEVNNDLHDGQDLPSAVNSAVGRWMGWSINRTTSREMGIPLGLPYLKGLIAHFEIQAEEAA